MLKLMKLAGIIIIEVIDTRGEVMSSCEKCWNDAYRQSIIDDSKSQSEWYEIFLFERFERPCTPKEQAGQWWDEENQCDKRDNVSQE